MPCSDSGAQSFIEDHRVRQMEEQHARQVNMLSAMLCGLLTAAQNLGTLEAIIACCDFKEAGVTESQLRTWWKRHQERDAMRKKIKQHITP